MELERIVQTVNRLAMLYWCPSGVQDQKYVRSLIGDWRQAFIEFLSSYAFERQGSSPHYPPAAVKAVELYEAEIPEQDFEMELWDSFLKSGGFPPDGKGANKKNNPLLPPDMLSDSKYCSASSLSERKSSLPLHSLHWSDTT